MNTSCKPGLDYRNKQRIFAYLDLHISGFDWSKVCWDHHRTAAGRTDPEVPVLHFNEFLDFIVNNKTLGHSLAVGQYNHQKKKLEQRHILKLFPHNLNSPLAIRR